MSVTSVPLPTLLSIASDTILAGPGDIEGLDELLKSDEVNLFIICVNLVNYKVRVSGNGKRHRLYIQGG